MFLDEKGYDVKGVNSGVEALDEVDMTPYDLVFLDENMPGLNGIETLQRCLLYTSPSPRDRG